MRLSRFVMALALCVAASSTCLAQAEAASREWVTRGDEMFRAGRYRESIAAFERSLQLRAPNAAESAWRIARAYARLGNAKQASRWVMHARQLGFTDERAIASEPGMRGLLETAARRDRSLLRLPTGCTSICVRSANPPPLRS